MRKFMEVGLMFEVGRKIKFRYCGKEIEGEIIEVRNGKNGKPVRIRIKTPKGSKIWRKVYDGVLI